MSGRLAKRDLPLVGKAAGSAFHSVKPASEVGKGATRLGFFDAKVKGAAMRTCLTRRALEPRFQFCDSLFKCIDSVGGGLDALPNIPSL